MNRGSRIKVGQQQEVAALRALLDGELVRGPRRVAIDGGAHIGAQTAVMAEHFETVHAFEPTPETYAVLVENVAANVTAHPEALMDGAGRVRMQKPKPKAPWTSCYALRDDEGTVRGSALDKWAFRDVDLIKLDLEGGEGPALLGARKTIFRWRPFIIIEEFCHGHRYGYAVGDVQTLLEGWGYVRVWDGGPNLGFAHRRPR